MNLAYEIEIYRLCTLCGIYSKEELIKYLDNLISELDDVPFEVIEASLLSNKNINDISKKLKGLIDEKIYNEALVTEYLLHIISEKYYTREISLEDAIYYLDNMLKETYLPEEIIKEIQYLSDGLYLAKQNIYGETETIRKDFEKFINKGVNNE
ncbi:hypothetical protein BH721_10485 [Clostridium baratii]|uniref:hypothetical protein n=1 Tax=Clostridium baratii TaxID=1561 RepID=UPI0009A2C8A3|nr:hypothetical protein [Clostridium baratii]OPF51892.1 hypothetical protein A1M12_05000 [Clostridium baratii]OPF53538.1 hypothetical protein BH721_10485 [Clostridium baratii]OPF56529.1 hypothetical protein BH724_12050 [Clostridium baratii]OPF60585.1 hypothetical protein BH725_08450 [Clostridium baratii]